jgi:hypothetical protein
MSVVLAASPATHFVPDVISLILQSSPGGQNLVCQSSIDQLQLHYYFISYNLFFRPCLQNRYSIPVSWQVNFMSNITNSMEQSPSWEAKMS